MNIRGGSVLLYNNSGNCLSAQLHLEDYQTEDWPQPDQIHNTFLWDNTGASYWFSNSVSVIQEDRDYFKHAPASSGGKTTLINYGLDGMTFSSSGANAYYPYTAYTYPHPLRGAGTPDETAPVLTVQSPAASVVCTIDPMNITEQYSSNEAATVKWDTTDKSYDLMANTFSTTGGTTHSRTVSRACGASYTIYARGMDVSGNKAAASTTLTYTIGAAEPETPIFIDGTKYGENSAAAVQGVCTDTYLNVGEPDTAKHLSTSLGFWTDAGPTPGHTNLIKFDLSSIPTTATVTAAKLYLSLTSYGGDTSYEVTAHKVTGKAAVVAEATWNSAATGLAWTAAGGLSDVAASESTEVVGTDLTWYEWTLTTMVGQWVATPATNYGVLLASDQTENTATENSYRYFASSNKADATLRPILIVAYTVPDPAGGDGEAAKTINITGGTLTLKPSGGSLTITW